MPLASLTSSITASTVPAHALGSAELQVLPTCPLPSVALLLSSIYGGHHRTREVEVGRGLWRSSGTKPC